MYNFDKENLNGKMETFIKGRNNAIADVIGFMLEWEHDNGELPTPKVIMSYLKASVIEVD